MSEVINKHSRMPRKLSRRTLRRREQMAIGGVYSLSEVNPSAVVERYIAGEKIKTMAQQYGVSDISLYAFLLRNVPDEWMAAQSARAFAKKERGEDGLEDAEDPLEVAKARETLRAGQWDLERVRRKDYGRESSEINIHVGDLGEILRTRIERAQARVGQVIEHREINPPTAEQSRGRELAVIDGGKDVQAQQYDSEAAQHEPIMQGSSVDKS